MPINIPSSAQEVEARSKADVQRELQQSNPFLKNSWLGAIVTACANRIYDFYLQLRAALRESFPDTATGDYAIRWAAIFGLQILPASQSKGQVVATGDEGAEIPSGTILTVSGVGNFTTDAIAAISASTIEILDLQIDGQTATATTEEDHGLANGVDVTITGAFNPEYNTTAAVIVTAADKFQYQVVGSPAEELASNAQASFLTAQVSVTSEDFGSSVNLEAGTLLSLQSPLIGIDDTLTVDFDAVGGGSNQETPAELQARTLEKIRNPASAFNVAAIRNKAKEVAGVTRVFVFPVTPNVGQVTTYFMRDNDADPIPSGSEVAAVKNKLLEIKPASIADDDLIVLAPTSVPVDFTFTSLVPDTPTMRASVTANLNQFFNEFTDIGADIDEDSYRSAIINTFDTATGQRLTTFELSEPIGDIVAASGEIGTLGTVSYP